MLTKPLSTAAMIAITVGFGASAAAADPLRDAPPYNKAVEREAAQTWLPDAAARATMDELRVAVETGNALPRSDAGSDPLVRLGADIEARVAPLANCCADQQASTLHLRMLVAEISDGAQLMRTATHHDARRMGLLKVVQALNLYGALFEHPGWRVIDEQFAATAARR